jgi:hypothetical protein
MWLIIVHSGTGRCELENLQYDGNGSGSTIICTALAVVDGKMVCIGNHMSDMACS